MTLALTESPKLREAEAWLATYGLLLDVDSSSVGNGYNTTATIIDPLNPDISARFLYGYREMGFDLDDAGKDALKVKALIEAWTGAVKKYPWLGELVSLVNDGAPLEWARAFVGAP